MSRRIALDTDGLIRAAGLDPSQVTLAPLPRLLRRQLEVRAALLDGSFACSAWGKGSTEANAATALAGLVDLISYDPATDDPPLHDGHQTWLNYGPDDD
ncbi:MAG: hypothetical protein JWN29_1035 [Acidimicrobiales bacterium]|nr:hypothetical protein [Acidimicrobiales bacterium]